MQDFVQAALQAGATLVTANQRLARHLAAEYGTARRTHGAPVWETPDILPWTQWLERFWQESFGLLDGDAPQPLLSSFQELTLWETVIHDIESAPLLHEPAAARGARDAWQLLHAWRLPLARAGEFANEDATAFVAWARAYQKHCNRHNYLDSARLPDAVQQAIERNRLRLPQQLLLAGFDEFTPQQQALLDAVRAAGSGVDVLGGGVPETRAARVAFVDALAELRAAAAWARAGLEAGAQRIGIVVPDLAASRDALMRVFDEALVPQALIAGANIVRPYNLSLGEPLAGVPLIHAALTVLAAGSGPLPAASASLILRSRYLTGFDEEAAARARIDLELRQTGEVSLTAHGLMRTVQAALTAKASAAPKLAAQMRAWRDMLPSKDQRLAPSGWSELFARLLQRIGWPGDGEPDHDRVRTIETWRELLAQLAAQDAMTPRLNYDDALSLLRRMAQERVFQPPTPAAPVQVLGLMEAAGLEFDRLWVMGLDDETWPPSPRPNPFLPFALQRKERMPHASAERELEFAHHLTERLLNSAPEVVFSHAENFGDEERRPSPLILPLAELRPDDLPPPVPGVAARQFAATAMTRITDERAPELPPGSRVSGGTSLLQYQAACPFRAFAQLRLGARAPEEPEPGLDAATRGQLVHEAFRFFWEDIQSHERLCALTEAEQETAIQAAITKAVERAAHERSQTLSGRFREIETERLAALLRQWLEIEKQRAPFELHVAEKETRLKLGGLELSGRIDRIDTLADGRVAIMDYKTGQPKTKDWEGERPDEPQLPAYAVGREPPLPVAALLFAQLRPGDGFGFKGLAASDGIAPKVKAAKDWDAQLAAWRTTLDKLADDFRRGDARVDPKEFPRTCEYCGLTALCRVHEQGIAPAESDATEAADE
jgi:ATP-dependent helicase/nuclease subunit B